MPWRLFWRKKWADKRATRESGKHDEASARTTPPVSIEIVSISPKVPTYKHQIPFKKVHRTDVKNAIGRAQLMLCLASTGEEKHCAPVRGQFVGDDSEYVANCQPPTRPIQILDPRESGHESCACARRPQETTIEPLMPSPARIESFSSQLPNRYPPGHPANRPP